MRNSILAAVLSDFLSEMRMGLPIAKGLWICTLLSLYTSTRGSLTDTCDGSPQGVLIQGDAMLSSILAMRGPVEDEDQDCEHITGDVQAYEAMRWTLGRLNQNSGQIGLQTITDSYVPGIKLGVTVHDTCGRPELVTGALLSLTPQMTQEECLPRNSSLFLGAIGGVEGTTMLPAAAFFGKAGFPLISYQSRLPSLSNRDLYPSFLRTTSSDGESAEVIMKIFTTLDWQATSVVYTDDLRGEELRAAFMQLAKETGLCILQTIQLPSINVAYVALESAVRKLVTSGSPLVVFMGESTVLHGLLNVAAESSFDGALHWIVSGSAELDVLQHTKAAGLIEITKADRHVAEFEDHWVSLNPDSPPTDNPWYREWYMQTKQCQLPGEVPPAFRSLPVCSVDSEMDRRGEYVQSASTLPAILAVYGYAKALKAAHQDLCNGVPGICQQLQNISSIDFFQNYLQTVDLTFSQVERIPTLASSSLPPYNSAERIVFDPRGNILGRTYQLSNLIGNNFRFSFKQVGTYSSGVLSLDVDSLVLYGDDWRNPITHLPEVTCTGSLCIQCLQPDPQPGDVKVASLSGEILIAGVFSVHLPGLQSLACGPVDIHKGSQLLQAFLYAINRARFEIFNSGVTFGGIGFDDCGSRTMSQEQIISLLGRTLNLKDYQGNNIDVDAVQGFLVGNPSSFSLTNSGLGQALSLPVIAYDGTSTNDNSQMLNAWTTPGINREVEALVTILKRLRISFIQLLYPMTPYGKAFSDIFHDTTSKENICIVTSRGYDARNIDFPETVAMLNTDTRLVVFVGDGDSFQSLLESLSSNSQDNTFTLMTSTTMNSYMDFMEQIPDGTISLAYQNPTLHLLNAYLNEIDPPTHTTNPWFREWYTESYQCYWGSFNPRNFTRRCGTSSILESGRFVQYDQGISVINGVEAFSRGLHRTLQHYCGDSYDTLCTRYLTAEDRWSRLKENVLSATFMDITGKGFNFQDGEANRLIDVLLLRQRQYSKVGVYNPRRSTLAMSSELDIESTCTPPCEQCLYVDYSERNNYISTPGDFLIASLFNVHHQGVSPYSCGDLQMTKSVQLVEAFRYAIDSVNSANSTLYQRGVRLGGLVLDSCSSDIRGLSIASNIHSGRLRVGNNQTAAHNIIGWMSQSSGTTSMLAQLTAQLPVAQVGVDADAYGLFDEGTFYGVSGSSAYIAAGITRFLLSFDWRYVNVVYSPDQWYQSLADGFHKVARESEICILKSYEFGGHGSPDGILRMLHQSPSDVVVLLTTNEESRALFEAKLRSSPFSDDLVMLTLLRQGTSSDISKGLEATSAGSIVLAPYARTPNHEFLEWLSSLFPTNIIDANPWFTEYYQLLFQCNLGSRNEFPRICSDVNRKSLLNASEFVLDSSVSDVIHGVYSLASALDITLKQLCGADYQGICPEFPTNPASVRKAVLANMDFVSFIDGSGSTFQFSEKLYDPGYVFYRLDERGIPRQVVEYHRGTLTVNDPSIGQSYGHVTSACHGYCLLCQYVNQRSELFTYTPGEVLIGGFFDIHDKGDSPFTCDGTILDQGVQLMESFNYAIEFVNSHNGIFAGKFNNITLGGIGFDACKNPTRAGNMLANIHSGMLPLQIDGQTITMDKTGVYVGGYDSATSQKMADVLKVLEIPQISYGASSTVFQDRESYPSFFRTVPADDQQSRAIVAWLIRFGLTYVQTVYSKGVYGEQASRHFQHLATSRGICVSQSIVLEEGETVSAVQELLRVPQATVVVVFLDTDSIRPFLEAINSNTAAANTFKFIGSQTWADSLSLVDGLNNLADKVITFGVETADVVDFDRYLNNKNPRLPSANPWFAEYYEHACECSLANDLTTTYQERCAASPPGVITSCPYSQDPYILYTINAVFSAALGIHNALVETCGQNYAGVCDRFSSQHVTDGIRQVQFEDATRRIVEFSSNGESNRGYHIYSLKNSLGGAMIYYENVGSYNDTHHLRIDAQYRLTWKSDCSAPSACAECPVVKSIVPRYAAHTTPTGLNLIGFFPVHKASTKNPFQCGALDVEFGFQNFVAFLFAMDNWNGNHQDSAEWQLGGVGVDTCNNALSVTADVYGLLAGADSCAQELPLNILGTTAVITMTSEETSAAVDLLSPQNITTLSPYASSSLLNGEPYLLRAVPPSDDEGRILASVIQEMGWQYVAVVKTNDDYGEAATDAFIGSSMSDAGSCVVAVISLESNAATEDAERVVETLDKTPGAIVVVLFTSPGQTRNLLAAVTNTNLQDKFIILGGASFGSDTRILDEFSQTFIGSIYLQLQTAVPQAFVSYMTSLTVANHGAIPDVWFEEYWQHQFQCRLANATRIITQYTRICTRSDRLTRDMILLDPSVLNTIIMTQIVAEARSSTHRHSAYEMIKNGQWRAPNNFLPNGTEFQFNFSRSGYGNLGYAVFNYVQTGSRFQPIQIGSYNQKELSLDQDAYTSGRSKVPTSKCPLGLQCTCFNGTGGKGANNIPGNPGSQPVVDVNENFTVPWGIVLSVLTGFGLLCALFMFVYLVIFYPIRGGTTPIGILLLFGVMLMYALNFAFIVQAGDVVCALRRFCLPFVYALCFSCLLVKVLNNWRLGGYHEFTVPSGDRLAHPCSIFFITISITLVQVGLGVQWLLLDYPDHDLYEDPDFGWVTRCVPFDFHYEELVLSCVYVMVLIFVTLVFAAVTWDSGENHRESRWVLFATCITVALFVIWSVLTTQLDWRYRDPALVIVNLINATIILICMFVRKLYLLTKYEKEEEKRSVYALEMESERARDGYTNSLYARERNGTNSLRRSGAGSSLGDRHSAQASTLERRPVTRGYDTTQYGPDVQY